MIPKGTPVVVTDPNVQDIYNAILTEDWDDTGAKNPASRIQTMIRYPIQQAIMYPDISSENGPLLEDEVYRLKVLSIRATDETACSYEESVARARLVAIEYAKQHGRADCLEILKRHEQGLIRRRRSVLAVK